MKKFLTLLCIIISFLSIFHFVLPSYATDTLWINNTADYYTTDPVSILQTAIRGGQLINVPNKNITIVSFYLTKVGSPTGSAYCVIRKESTDAVLANSSALDVSTIPTWTNKAWFNFTIISPPIINEDVRIQFEFNGGSSSWYPAMCLSNGTAISGNYTHYKTSYTNYTAFDTMMQIYVDVTGPTSLTFNGEIPVSFVLSHLNTWSFSREGAITMTFAVDGLMTYMRPLNFFGIVPVTFSLLSGKTVTFIKNPSITVTFQLDSVRTYLFNPYGIITFHFPFTGSTSLPIVVIVPASSLGPILGGFAVVMVFVCLALILDMQSKKTQKQIE